MNVPLWQILSELLNVSPWLVLNELLNVPLWQMLSEHFVHVGSHENLNVSIFAIDSLRQLADKFLIKEEFASFNF